MNPYIKKLQEHLEKNPRADGQSVLKVLCNYYTMEHAVDTEEIHRRFQELDDILRQLPVSQHTRVTDLVCILCGAHIEEGFLDGVQTGFRLSAELEAQGGGRS